MKKFSSILDPIQATLNPNIWSPDQIMKPDIKLAILNMVHELLGLDYSQVIAIGTTTGYQYTNTSDIDVNVRIPDWKDTQEVQDKRKKLNGRLAPGTNHPINLFLQAIPEEQTTSWNDSAFGAYDVMNDVWLAPPTKVLNQDPGQYYKSDFVSAHLALDEFVILTKKYLAAVKAAAAPTEYPIHQTDKSFYDLKKLKLNLHKEQCLRELYTFVKYIDAARKMEYALGWGIPRLNWRNVLYKIIDGSPYSKFFEYVNNMHLEASHKRSLTNPHPGIYENTTY